MRPNRVSLLTLLGVLITAGCQGSGSDFGGQSGSRLTPRATAAESTQTAYSAPPRFIVEGRGKTKRSITFTHEFSPAVFFARFPQGDVLSVKIRGAGLQRRIGESGAFIFEYPQTGATGVPRIAAGTYSLRVSGTKTSWALEFTEPAPATGADDLLAAVTSGSGDAVRTLRLERESDLGWEMRSSGYFLSASLIGYNEAEGAEQQLGAVSPQFSFMPSSKGFRTEAPLPAGDYLLVVDADADWSVEFARLE